MAQFEFPKENESCYGKTYPSMGSLVGSVHSENSGLSLVCERHRKQAYRFYTEVGGTDQFWSDRDLSDKDPNGLAFGLKKISSRV